MTKRNDHIVVEINERLTVSNEAERFEAYCSECKKMSEMTTPKIAAVLTGISERDVFRLIERTEIHYLENVRVLVCVESLRQRLADFNTAPDQPIGVSDKE